jgi:hypothetical protein
MPRRPASGARQVRLVYSALMLGMLLAALDQTIVATALPTITGNLHGLNRIGWAVTAYLLAVAVVMPIYGKTGTCSAASGCSSWAQDRPPRYRPRGPQGRAVTSPGAPGQRTDPAACGHAERAAALSGPLAARRLTTRIFRPAS